MKYKETKFVGFWKNEDNYWYNSYTYSVKSIKEIIDKNKNLVFLLRQNKYYEKDGNKPRFIMRIVCSNESLSDFEDKELNSEEKKDFLNEILEELAYIKEKLSYIDRSDFNSYDAETNFFSRLTELDWLIAKIEEE